MNKILRMAFVAAVALVSANTFAQNADVTFSLTKMVDNGWEKGQSLDNVEYSQKNVTIAFSKADGETDPIYREVEDSKGNKSVIAALTIGNKLTLTSDKFTFTKIQFKPTAKGKSPKSEKSGPNYEMTMVHMLVRKEKQMKPSMFGKVRHQSSLSRILTTRMVSSLTLS